MAQSKGLGAMNEPKWRGATALCDQRREYIRQNCPKGSDGFVAEDLDLVVRHFGPHFNQDAKGKLRLIECKVGVGEFSASKRMTFGLLDEMCRSSNMRDRYEGFFLVYSEKESWADVSHINVNGFALTHEQFGQWMNRKLRVPCIQPQSVPKNLSAWSVIPEIKQRKETA